MNQKTRLSGVSLISLAAAATLISAMPQMVLAQTAAPAAPAAKADAETIIITGTRRSARSAANTPAPVDVVSGVELTAQAGADTTALVRNLIPSFNVNTQSINDAASIVKPANLRGMAPDHTLVLVNGKRRHRASVIAFVGGGISNGSQGPDLSMMPSIGVKQLEVLRDGAAAQYGSDAIAGVMNFILRRDTDSFEVNAKYGQTYAGDGAAYTVAGNFGIALGSNGFANLSLEYGAQDPTSRSVQRSDAAGLKSAGNTLIADPVQIWGQPEVKGDFKAFLNTGFDLGQGREIYAFANYATRENDGGFYFRNPNTRSGVYSNDDGVTRLVGDTTPGTGTTCPVITIGSPGEAAAIAAVKADATCFIFNESFPGGFTPRFGGKLVDMSVVAGTKGEVGKLTYDVSYGFGRNDVEFSIRNTVNASLGPNSPTSFKPGQQIQTEQNFNIDLGYTIPVKGLASDLNLAGGFEWRNEQFELIAGELASYVAGPLTDQGFEPASNGFRGFRPTDAGVFDRANTAFYIDAEADLTENLVLGAAFRTEDFDDFGRTTNFKVSGLLRATNTLTLRSTYSTGFRAPTPGQSNIVNTSTILIGGVLNNRGTVSPTSVLGQLLGGKPLKAETSKNLSIGAGLNVGALKMTLDFFNIKMEDRIAQRAGIALSPAQIAALTPAQLAALTAVGGLTVNLNNFTYFINGVDTTTSGVDFVASYPMELFGGRTTLTATANFTNTDVDRGQDLLGKTITRQVEESLPNLRGNFSVAQKYDKWSFSSRINYFGSYWEAHADEGDLPINADAQITVDAEASYAFNDKVTISLGAENLLDSYPSKNPWSGILGAKYSVIAPAGFSGGFYYLKLSYKH